MKAGSDPGRAPLRDLAAAAAWLEGLLHVEHRPEVPYRRLGLDAIDALLERLGRPERRLSVVHVAGSKGKGSTALLVESVLRAAGERVATFTSPHLTRWTERFRIGGLEVDPASLVDAVYRVRPHVEALRAERPERAPTFFDATTAVALLLFAEARVDRAILEVGLGGRLDSTNVVDPAVSCIVSIELEHTDRLGDTLAAIAQEKAGIVKAARPVVTGDLPPEAARVVAARAREAGAPLARLGQEFHVRACPRRGAPGSRLHFRDGAFEVEAELPVPGLHQAHNAAVALAAIRRLEAHGDGALRDAARTGLAEARLPGRAELLGADPWLLVDAAHTPASARALREVMESIPARRVRLVLSISGGKDVEALLGVLLPGVDEVYVTRAEPRRSLDPHTVAGAVRTAAARIPVHAVPNPFVALRAAREATGPGDLLVATGSVYLAGIARRVLSGPRTGPDPRRHAPYPETPR